MSDSGIIFFSDKGELETGNKLFIAALKKCRDVTEVSKSPKPEKSAEK